MAALQSIRKKGALLVGVLGLALFAFIAEEFFRSIETTSAINRSQVGEVYGEKLSIQDFQNLVDEQIEFRKLQKQMQGQEGTLTDSETDQIREQVWQQFVSSKIIEHEADKLGLFVTDGEVQEALRSGEAQALQMMAGIFPNQQTGKFDLAQLQAFLKDYDKTVAQAKQAQNAEAVEQLELIKNLWTYTEKQLRQELLNNKFNMLFAMGYISNPVSAKMSFEERAELANAEIAAVPYSSIDDKVCKKYLRLLAMSARPGDLVEPFTGANKSLGDMFLHFESREMLDRMTQHPCEWIQVNLENKKKIGGVPN